MGKQKIVLKLTLDDERKRRKAFKVAVGMNGVTSATIEGHKIIVVGDGVDPITLATMLRRSLGGAELLSVGSGDDKKKSDGYGGGGGGMMYGGGGGGMGYGGGKEGSKEGKESGKGSGGGGGGQYQYQYQYPAQAVPPVSYPAYQQYNAMPSYPAVYSYPATAYYPQQEQDPGCRVM